MDYTGCFITIEGNEGTGKTTQLAALRPKLEALFGDKVVFVREPGGCKIAEQIRNVIVDKGNNEMDSICELLLYEASRAQHTREIIIPALKEGKVVISDRFFDSSYAYQGYGRGIDLRIVNTLSKIAACGLNPDLTIWLQGNPALIRQRKAGEENRMDLQELDFYQRVEDGYKALSQIHSDRYVAIPPGTIEQVQDAIYSEIINAIIA